MVRSLSKEAPALQMNHDLCADRLPFGPSQKCPVEWSKKPIHSTIEPRSLLRIGKIQLNHDLQPLRPLLKSQCRPSWAMVARVEKLAQPMGMQTQAGEAVLEGLL